MNVFSFLFCFTIRIVDLVIRAFDRFCNRVIKIYYEDDRHRHRAQARPPIGVGRAASNSVCQSDLQRWLLRLVGILFFVTYVWVMFYDEEEGDVSGKRKRRKIRATTGRLAFANLKM